MYSLYGTWGFPCEFPHSEISGSQAMCAYPKLIAAYHVLHRLLMPRHSPCALCSLTYLRVVVSANYCVACTFHVLTYQSMLRSFHVWLLVLLELNATQF